MEIGKWDTVYIEPWPPEWLEKFKEKADLIAQYMVASLEVLNVMCEVIKALLVGLTDPISALIKALIEEIKKLLNDLGQLGLYFTSDWKLTRWPFEDLYGGYQQAEKRMLARLLNRMDPGRPDVSSNSLVIAVMFYASVDTQAIYSLINTIRKILQLFSFDIKGGQFSPISSLAVKYSTDDDEYRPRFGEDVFTKPTEITLEWMQENTLDFMGVQIPLPMADNFLIEISTVKGGMPLYLLRQDMSQTGPGGKTGKGKPKTKAYPVLRTQGTSIGQLRLYGGTDRFESKVGQQYAKAVDKDGDLKPGGSFFFCVDPSNKAQPIPIELMKDSKGNCFYQKSFIFGKSSDLFDEEVSFSGAPALGFPLSITMDAEELPKAGKVEGTGKDMKIVEDTENPATNFYFRVTALSKLETGVFSYTLDPSRVNSNKDGKLIALTRGVESPPSPEATLRSARKNTKLYVEALESALIAQILSHQALDNSSSASTPFLEADADKIGGWFGNDPKIFQRVQAPDKFRTQVRNVVKGKAREIMKKSGPLSASVEQFVIDESKELREWKWSDYNSKLPNFTLRQSFGLAEADDSNGMWDDEDFGVAQNLFSVIFPQLVGQIDLEALFDMTQVPLEMNPVTYQAGQSINPANREVKIPLEQYEKKVSELKLKRKAQGLTNNSYWARRTTEELEYLEGAVLKTATGQLVLMKKKDKECVQLLTKSNWSAVKNKKRELRKVTFPFHSTPMIYFDRDEILAEAHFTAVTLRKINVMKIAYQQSLVTRIFYTRDILISVSDPILNQAAFVLNIATASISTQTDSDWQYVRLNAWLTFDAIIDFLEKLLNNIAAIMDTLQDMIEAILKFIDYVQMRIVEVQNLIRKINAIIQSLGLFDLPSCSIIFFASAGTEGLVKDIIQAEEKPSDQQTAVGWAGLGLIPIPFVNLIVDLFFPDTDVQGLLEQGANDLIDASPDLGD